MTLGAAPERQSARASAREFHSPSITAYAPLSVPHHCPIIAPLFMQTVYRGKCIDLKKVLSIVGGVGNGGTNSNKAVQRHNMPPIESPSQVKSGRGNVLKMSHLGQSHVAASTARGRLCSLPRPFGRQTFAD